MQCLTINIEVDEDKNIGMQLIPNKRIEDK